MKEYCVQEWGSHPDNGNDDCWTGEDFDTMEDARKAFDAPCTDTSTQYVELCKYTGMTMLRGREVMQVERIDIRLNPNFRPTKDDDDDWRHERAMQAGMGLGIDAYNEEMDYD
jgi:hypothetical protein